MQFWAISFRTGKWEPPKFGYPFLYIDSPPNMWQSSVEFNSVSSEDGVRKRNKKKESVQNTGTKYAAKTTLVCMRVSQRLSYCEVYLQLAMVVITNTS